MQAYRLIAYQQLHDLGPLNFNRSCLSYRHETTTRRKCNMCMEIEDHTDWNTSRISVWISGPYIPRIIITTSDNNGTDISFDICRLIHRKSQDISADIRPGHPLGLFQRHSLDVAGISPLMSVPGKTGIIPVMSATWRDDMWRFVLDEPSCWRSMLPSHRIPALFCRCC
jgi:hypothetical protein